MIGTLMDGTLINIMPSSLVYPLYYQSKIMKWKRYTTGIRVMLMQHEVCRPERSSIDSIQSICPGLLKSLIIFHRTHSVTQALVYIRRRNFSPYKCNSSLEVSKRLQGHFSIICKCYHSEECRESRDICRGNVGYLVRLSLTSQNPTLW